MTPQKGYPKFNCCEGIISKFKENSPISVDSGVVALMPDRKVLLSYQAKKSLSVCKRAGTSIIEHQKTS